MKSVKDTALEVEVAYMELAEALGLHQDDIPGASFILTKLAVACYNKGARSEYKPLKRVPTEPRFRSVPREDETPRVVIIHKDKDF